MPSGRLRIARGNQVLWPLNNGGEDDGDTPKAFSTPVDDCRRKKTTTVWNSVQVSSMGCTSVSIHDIALQSIAKSATDGKG